MTSGESITGCGIPRAGARPSVILIADDLTGAADSGVTFTQQGANALVVWDPAQLADGIAAAGDADVLAISTESRHCSPQEAERRVTAAMAGLSEFLHRQDPPWIYKKIDSTLRGHPGLELATVLRAMGAAVEDANPVVASSGALVAPAFPAQGRITREGIHYVHGIPLNETVFGQEVSTSRVLELFEGAFEPGVVGELPLPGSAVFAGGTEGDDRRERVLVADAVTEADLVSLVEVAMRAGTRVLCGSAGLADAFAERLAKRCGWCRPSDDAVSVPGSCSAVLVVAASRHPQTRRQVEMLRDAGVAVVSPPEEWFLGKADEHAGMVAHVAETLAEGVAALTTVGLPDLPVSGDALVARLAQVVVPQFPQRGTSCAADISRHMPELGLVGLVLTGGDAAIAVSDALGAQALRLYGEVASGMPWGILVGGMGDGVPVVTKAGGFGDDDALLRAVQFLRGVSCD